MEMHVRNILIIVCQKASISEDELKAVVQKAIFV